MKYEVESMKESIGRVVSEGFADESKLWMMSRIEKIISSGTFYRTIIIVFSLDTVSTGIVVPKIGGSHPRNRRNIHATDCLDNQLFTGSTTKNSGSDKMKSGKKSNYYKNIPTLSTKPSNVTVN